MNSLTLITMAFGHGSVRDTTPWACRAAMKVLHSCLFWGCFLDTFPGQVYASWACRAAMREGSPFLSVLGLFSGHSPRSGVCLLACRAAMKVLHSCLFWGLFSGHFPRSGLCLLACRAAMKVLHSCLFWAVFWTRPQVRFMPPGM